MSTRTIGRIVGALTLTAMIVYLSGGELVQAGAPGPGADTGSPEQIGVGALLMLTNSVVVIGIGVLMVPILRRRHEITACAYLAARVAEGVLLAVGVLALLTLITLARAQPDSGGLVELALQADEYARHIGMIGLGIGGALFCRALFLDRLVPRPLAVLGMIGYPVLAAGEALDILGAYDGLVHTAPGGLFEVALGVLLLVRGFPEPPMAARTPQAAGTPDTSQPSDTARSTTGAGARHDTLETS